METMLEECTTKGKHSVVDFLWAKGLSAKDIYKEMFPVHDGKCVLRKAAHNWIQKFSQGHLKVADDAQQSRPV
jgi:hypothetical protein